MLKLNQINKTYADGTQALKNVTLDIPSGMIGLLGPNGAGKSSLMRIMASLLKPDTGSINFDGIDVMENPHSLRKQLGYLPQSFGVYPHMSCRAILHHMAILKGVEKKYIKSQINNLLELTNLAAVAHKKASKFSGGMLQRFGIAQCLLGDPKLIIMDEPTSGLDPMERESFSNLLVKLSERRLVILSTHIVEDIENLCHHVAIINQGTVIESSDIRQLIKPLENKVWQCNTLPEQFPHKYILSKTHRQGESVFRVFSESIPTKHAIAVKTTLQDKYFYQLNQCEVSVC